MPQALSDAEIAAAVAEAIAATGAKAPADMGKVMGVLKAKLAGRADMGKVSALVKAKLSANRLPSQPVQNHIRRIAARWQDSCLRPLP